MGTANEKEKENHQKNTLRVEKSATDLSANSLVLSVMLIGDSDVGKTTIVKNYIKPRGLTGETPESIILNSDGRSVRMVIYDTLTGDSRASSVLTTSNWRVVSQHVEKSAIILVFDLTKTGSIDGNKGVYNYLDQMEKHVERGVNVYLVANKVDCLNEREVTEGQITKLIQSENAKKHTIMNGGNVIYLNANNELAVKNELFGKIVDDLLKANPVKT